MSTDFNSSMDELDFAQTLHERQVRRVYLITYSQANLVELPTCKVFADKLLEFFRKKKMKKIYHCNGPAANNHMQMKILSHGYTFRKIAKMDAYLEICTPKLWYKSTFFIPKSWLCYSIQIYLQR